jgi:signal recognition particle receptor subunit beta
MPLVDRRTHSVVLRIVYDGPPDAGKTTNLRRLGERLSLSRRTTLEFPGDERTQFFDWLDVAGGPIGGRRVRCQLVTAPGQLPLAPRRRFILDSADAVVFVADSQASAAPQTSAALRSLTHGLRARADVPLVLQANKQDLPRAQAPGDLHAALGLATRVPAIGAQAAGGAGVLETFLLAVRLAVDHVRAMLVGGALDDGDPATAAELLAALEADAPEVFAALEAIAQAADTVVDPAEPAVAATSRVNGTTSASNGVHRGVTGASNGVHRGVTGASNGVHRGASNGVHHGVSNGVHHGASNGARDGATAGASNGVHHRATKATAPAGEAAAPCTCGERGLRQSEPAAPGLIASDPTQLEMPFLGTDDDPTWDGPAVEPGPAVVADVRRDSPPATGDEARRLPALIVADPRSGARIEVASPGAADAPVSAISDAPFHLPPVDLPAGMVWPGVSGRAALAALAALAAHGTPIRVAPRTAPWAPTAAIELACGDRWSAHTSPHLALSDPERGWPLLLEAIRWHAKLNYLAAPGRTYALAPDGDGVRLWVVTPVYRTVWAAIEEAFERGDRATATRLARTGLEAVDELRARGLPIVDLDHIAIDEPLRFLATPWTPLRDRLTAQLQRLLSESVL